MHSDSIIENSLCLFSKKFYETFVNSNSGKWDNAFMSPLSVYNTMAMVIYGSEGETKSELLKSLQVPSNYGESEGIHLIGRTLMEFFKSTENVDLNLANRLFAEVGAEIQKSYKQNLLKSFGAETEGLDFKNNPENARERINNWIKTQTRDKIQELFSRGTVVAQTSIALVNAIYFKDGYLDDKLAEISALVMPCLVTAQNCQICIDFSSINATYYGLWENKFDKRSTRNDKFFQLDGSDMDIKLMHVMDEFPVADLPEFDAKSIKMPFLKSDWEMLVLLPTERNGLPNLVERLIKTDGIASVLHTHFVSKTVELYFPRFKIGEGEALDVKSFLKNMGLKAIFDSELADLTGICASSRLFITDVKHKAILEVDEEGAVAAGATGAMANSAYRSRPLIFRVDHPFFIIIKNNTIPVFLGHVTRPDSF